MLISLKTALHGEFCQKFLCFAYLAFIFLILKNAPKAAHITSNILPLFRFLSGDAHSYDENKRMSANLMAFIFKKYSLLPYFRIYRSVVIRNDNTNRLIKCSFFNNIFTLLFSCFSLFIFCGFRTP